MEKYFESNNKLRSFTEVACLRRSGQYSIANQVWSEILT